jgi:hypothetical protein
MNLNLKTPLSRRHVLRGLGVSLSLPLLDAMIPAALGAPSKYKPLAKSMSVQPRVIYCYVPNGVNIAEWLPKGTGRNYQLSKSLSLLKEHRDDFTVLSGLGHPNSTGGHTGADTWLTGADLKRVPGADYTNSISVDQIIAEKHGKSTRFTSLQLADASGTGPALHSHTLSFDRSGTPLPAQNSPQRLFNRLFSPESDDDRAATLRRFAEKKSILDNILGDAKKLHQQLGKTDQAKLDEYLGSVRQTEQRVQRLEGWVDVPKPNVDNRNLQLGSQPQNAHDRAMWIDVMLEISYLAFLTDTTRVITYEWQREAGGASHRYSHHGGDPEMLKSLASIDRFRVKAFARFLTFLKSTSEADGSMLDRTMVLFGSGMNNGSGGGHSPKNLPLILAGGRKLGLKHGQHLAHDEKNHPPFANVHLTMAQAMGVETDSFSDSKSTLTGLT